MFDSLRNFRSLGGPLYSQSQDKEIVERNPLGLVIHRSARPDHLITDDLTSLQSKLGVKYFLDLRNYKDEYSDENGVKILDKSGVLKVVDIEKMEKQRHKHIVWLKGDEKLKKSKNLDESFYHYMINFFGPSFIVAWLSDKRSPLWKRAWGIFLLMLFILFRFQHFVRFIKKDIESSGLLRLYTTTIDSSGTAIRSVLQIINSRGKTPFVICCHAGKDRTGIISAVLLSICGVDKDVIADDYHLSEAGLSYSQTDMKSYGREMRLAPKEIMLSLLDYIDGKYGSMSKYLQSIGFSLEEQGQLKRNLTIDA